MKIMYKKIINLIIICFVIGTSSLYGQVKTYKGELYTVIYSEDYQQPLQVTYKVLCPTGVVSRSGMDFWKPDGWKTSDNGDYKANCYMNILNAPNEDGVAFDDDDCNVHSSSYYCQSVKTTT